MLRILNLLLVALTGFLVTLAWADRAPGAPGAAAPLQEPLRAPATPVAPVCPQEPPEAAPEPVEAPVALPPPQPPEPPPGPSWPWKGNPGWRDAQSHPEAYEAWLQLQHPGQTIVRRWAKITAYCPCAKCCGRGSPGITRSGKSAWCYGIAVAEPVYQACRYGRKRLHIPGYMNRTYTGKAWLPDDTGSAMLDSYAEGELHIDLRYHNHDWAHDKGTRHGYVWYVL